MLFIQEEFNKLVGKDVTTNVLWKHLDTIYDMEALVSFILVVICHSL